MNNASYFSQKEDLSPIPMVSNSASPSSRKPYASHYFPSNGTPVVQRKSFPTPVCSSTPYTSHPNAQQKQRFCSPGAKQKSALCSTIFDLNPLSPYRPTPYPKLRNAKRKRDFSSPDQSLHGNKFLNSDRSSMYRLTPYPTQRCCSSDSEQETMFRAREFLSSRPFSDVLRLKRSTDGPFSSKNSKMVDYVSEETLCEKMTNFRPFTSSTFANNGATNAIVDFSKPELLLRGNRVTAPINPFRGTIDFDDQTPGEYGMEYGQSIDFRPNTKIYNSSALHTGKRRKLFGSPAAKECHPEYLPNVDDYMDCTVAEEQWKELNRMFELSKSVKINTNNSALEC